jgi:hypothetical protein
MVIKTTLEIPDPAESAKYIGLGGGEDSTLRSPSESYVREIEREREREEEEGGTPWRDEARGLVCSHLPGPLLYIGGRVPLHQGT